MDQKSNKNIIIGGGEKKITQKLSEFSILLIVPLEAPVSVWLNIYVPGPVDSPGPGLAVNMPAGGR